MTDKLNATYKRASRACHVGAVCMYTLALLMLLLTLTFVYAFTQLSVFDGILDISGRALLLVPLALVFVATVLLGEFFRCFRHTRSPFGTQQSRKILIAGLLFVAAAVFDSIPLASFDVALFPDSSFGVASPSYGLDMKVVVLAVFLICLSFVVRYSNALKEDSDSIV